MSKNYFAFEPDSNESILKLNSDGTYTINNHSGSTYSETSDWIDFDGGSGTYYLKAEGVDFSGLTYSSYVGVRFMSDSSQVTMYADKGSNPYSRQISNPSQVQFMIAFENGVDVSNLKVMLSKDSESEWESAFESSEPEPQYGTVNVVAYYQNSNGSWPSSPETIRSVQQQVSTAFNTSSDDRTPKKTPGSGIYVYDSSSSDQSVLVSSATTYTVEVRFKLNFTVTYTDGVSESQVFADQVYSNLDYGVDTPSFSGTPTRNGYTFTGWNPNVTSMVTANKTYTAQWQLNEPDPEPEPDTAQYTVQFFRQVNGSYSSAPYSTETRYGTIGDTVSTTTEDRTAPSGYAYDTSASNIQSTILQASGTILRVYFKQQFTVQYIDGVSNTVFMPQTYSNLDYGASTPEFSGTPSRPNYTFDGWSPTVTGTVTSNRTYTAIWSANSGSGNPKVLAMDKVTLIKTDEHLDEIENAQQAADDAQDTADEAKSTADSNTDRISISESTIQQLADQISTLVVDENGESMMTQTSDGWRFDMTSINQTLNDTATNLNELSESSAEVANTVDNLNSLVNDLSEKTAYILMTTDDEGNPCIELGKSDNDFKVRITNTSVDFLNGTSKIAYVSGQALYIEKAIIKNEIQIGEGSGFVFKRRGNGNMGVRWVGGDI